MADTAALAAMYASQNQGPHLMAACWLMTSLATVVVAGRFFIRYHIIKRGGADDWWMLAGLVFLMALTGLNTAMAAMGGFRHEDVLDAATLVQFKKLFWAAQPVGLVGSLLPKVSIGLQLLYIIPNSSQKYRSQRHVVVICLSVCTIVNLIGFPIVFVQCSPVEGLWSADGKCWSGSINTFYFALAAVVNALVDAIFALIPINIIMGLKISFINKAMLINFLGARMFAFIAGVTKAGYIGKNGFATGDMTWDAFDFLLWQTAEQFCLCFCGSFPTYKAMYDRWLRRRASLKALSTGDYSHGHSRLSKSSEWLYEKKCFEAPEEAGITVTTDINVYHERLDSKDDLEAGALPHYPSARASKQATKSAEVAIEETPSSAGTL